MARKNSAACDNQTEEPTWGTEKGASTVKMPLSSVSHNLQQGWSSSPVRASNPWRWVRSVGILLVYHALTRSNQTKRMLKQSVYAESGHTPASNCPSTGLSHPPQTPDYKVPYSSPRHQQSISSSLLSPRLANILLLMTEQRKMEVWGVSDICNMSHTRQDHMVLTKTHPSENISEKK